MLEIDINDIKEQRKFGLSTGGLLAVVGLIRYVHHHFAELPYILWTLAVVFALLGAFAPRTMRPVLRVMLPIAEKMNWVMTHVILTVAWFVVITPAALLYRAISGDPLNRQWQPDAKTYWEDAESIPKDIPEYKNQF